MRPRLLIADDQSDVLAALRLALSREGIEVVTVSSPTGALAAVAVEGFDAALIDLNYTRDTTSGAEGLELLGKLHQHDPTLPIIVMTAWATVGIAVEAMRSGARDRKAELAQLLRCACREQPVAFELHRDDLRGLAQAGI